MELHRIQYALLAVTACSSPAPPPIVPPQPPDAAPAIPPIVAAALTLTCDTPADWRPGRSFEQSGSVVRVRVAAASPGPVLAQRRCVALDLEFVDTFRGGAKLGDHLKLVIEQSMIEHYTSRPAGAWWIVEQDLGPGSEYVALCPPGALADVLRGSCTVTVAAPHLAGLALVRDAETRGVGGMPLIAKLRAGCAAADELATDYVWGKTGQQALADLAVFDALLAVVVEPTCSRTARAVLFDRLAGFAMTAEATPHVVRVARAMFRLLAMPEAAGLHDNLIGTYLPNALGLEGGQRKRKAGEVFAGDPKGRAEARRALTAYRGTADTAKLRAWLQ